MSRLFRAALVMGVVLLAACGASSPYPPSGPTSAPQNWPPPPPPANWPPRQPPPPTPAGGWSTPAATGAPVPGNTFADPGVNPYVDPYRDPLSTFAMDVDTASYDVAKRFLRDGNLPDRDSVRLEEYVNSFDYGYRPPTDSTFAIDVAGAPSPFLNERSMLLRIGIQAEQMEGRERPPLSLTFVIDTSGSMAIDNRLELVKSTLAWLVSRLRPDDTVAIVTFGSDAKIVLEPTSSAEPTAIHDALARLQPGGSTNAEAGLEMGYDLAERAHRVGAHDRVVLASDGVANVGLTDANSILQRIDREVAAGVELVSVGVGMGNFNDVLLEQLADRGNGFYAYINDESQAQELFAGRLIDALVTVAKDARVQVEFNRDVVTRYRLLGYENRAMSDQDFNNPAADAGEVGAGHSVTALYEVERGWSSGPSLGTVTLHWIDPATGSRESLDRQITTAAFGSDYYRASSSFRLAATVAGFAEILRQSPYVGGFTLSDVNREAAALARELPGHQDVVEFSALAATAAQIAPEGVNHW